MVAVNQGLLLGATPQHSPNQLCKEALGSKQLEASKA